MNAPDETITSAIPPAAKPLSPSSLGASRGAPDGPVLGPKVDLTEPKIPETEDATESEDTPMVCPNCSADLRGLAEKEVSEDDKTCWLRHILGEETFTKTYSLYDGQLRLTYRNSVAQDNGAVLRQLQEDLKNGVTQAETVFRAQVYYLGFYLAAVDRGDNEQVYLRPSDDTYAPDVVKEGERTATLLERVYDRLTSEFSEGVLTTLVFWMKDFEATAVTLMRNSATPDFWHPAGKDS